MLVLECEPFALPYEDARQIVRAAGSYGRAARQPAHAAKQTTRVAGLSALSAAALSCGAGHRRQRARRPRRRPCRPCRPCAPPPGLPPLSLLPPLRTATGLAALADLPPLRPAAGRAAPPPPNAIPHSQGPYPRGLPPHGSAPPLKQCRWASTCAQARRHGVAPCRQTRTRVQDFATSPVWYHNQGNHLRGREVTAVSAARATPAMGLEVREVGPIETPRHRDTVYLPATTVPPTVVALRPKRAQSVARAQFPQMGIDPGRHQPMQITPSIHVKSPEAIITDEGE